MKKNHSILLVDDEPDIIALFTAVLSEPGYRVKSANSMHTASEQLSRGNFDLVVSDIWLGEETGLDLLNKIRLADPSAYVILVTANPSMETAQEAVKAGAFDYLAKPVSSEKLLDSVRHALEHKQISDQKSATQRHLEAVFDSVQEALITIDQDGSIREVNRAGQRLCGLGAEVEGRSYQSVIHCEHLKALIEKVFSEKTPIERVEMTCTNANFEKQVINVSVSPLLDLNLDKGGFSGVVVVVLDVTRLARLEQNRRDRNRFHRLLGRSPAMRKVFTLIEDLAVVDTSVLITGDSGTGKELVAEALHLQGARGAGPMVKVNCAGLTETLLESELFGHVKGSFTGAHKDKTGRFQLANGGTIFLDEIGDISSNMQTRLLRVLQERVIERVGDARSIKLDIRVVAATNQNLEAKVARGLFRKDLFYRLNVVEIHLPALKDRLEDLPLLTNHFIHKFNLQFNKNIESVTSEVMEVFKKYSWPGNVRELEHVLEHGFVICRESAIALSHLPRNLSVMENSIDVSKRLEGDVISEREHVLASLKAAKWRKGKAAKALGVSRSTLYRWMERLNI
ncbi:MAG: sigma-54-dependent Fis family transcriptional regulator [Magnetococcales bacterium]|nr:sigma-54-dependent Fis family transcriptional regulator [Magnetococcales bacterium]